MAPRTARRTEDRTDDPADNRAENPSAPPRESAEPALSIHDLTVAYDSTPALWDIDLEVPQGVLMGVVGPNGAGKSTLIKAALDLVPRTAGTVRFYGKRYAKMRRNVGYVPQRGSVDWDFPTTVLDVVTMGRYGSLGWIRRPGKQERDMSMAALEKVSMAELADRQISHLSGGQQQRTFLARALVQDAHIYFMDEPFAAVDAVTERAIVSVLQELRAAGKTVIVVHHDLSTVTSYFDWVALLNVELRATGPTEEAFTRRNLEQTYGGRMDALELGTDGCNDTPDRAGSAESSPAWGTV
jgi:manganese/zinc/iron transport system ATP- binding protein